MYNELAHIIHIGLFTIFKAIVHKPNNNTDMQNHSKTILTNPSKEEAYIYIYIIIYIYIYNFIYKYKLNISNYNHRCDVNGHF